MTEAQHLTYDDSIYVHSQARTKLTKHVGYLQTPKQDTSKAARIYYGQCGGR